MPRRMYYSLKKSCTGPASNLLTVTPEKYCEDPYLKPFACKADFCGKFSMDQLCQYNCMRAGFNGRPVHFTYSRLSDDNWCSSETCGELGCNDQRVL